MTDFNIDRDGHSERERPIRPADDLGALGDREVPIAPVATSEVINKWLDGEVPEPTNLRGDAARSVEFWRRIGEETDRRRHMVTPAHVSAQIMAKLPPAVAQGSRDIQSLRSLELELDKAIQGDGNWRLGLDVDAEFTDVSRRDTGEPCCAALVLPRQPCRNRDGGAVG